MTERWFGGTLGALYPVTGATQMNFEVLDRGRGLYVVVEDTSAADTPVAVEHRLGRIPRGMVVVNQVVPSGTDPVAWYRVAGDADWTPVDVTVRWTVANARVKVWLF